MITDRNKKIISAFDMHAEQYAEQYADMSIYAESIASFMDQRPSKPRILDIACGPGNLLGFILKDIIEADITGIDLSPAMLAIARERFPEGEFLGLDMRDIDSLLGPFDRISCGFGIPYISIEELPTWIMKVYEGLASKGRVYLSMMIKSEPSSELILPSSGIGDGIMTSFFTQEMLLDELIKVGFNIEFEAFFKTDSAELQDYAVVASK